MTKIIGNIVENIDCKKNILVIDETYFEQIEIKKIKGNNSKTLIRC